MRIAIEGCMHGDLENVYSTLLHLEKVEYTKIDLLLCCGDFQAVRNADDLESLNVPPKFLGMGSFWKYYSGEKVAPFPTIFIGGNHEASNYLWELFGNIRIGGLSGIYNAQHYHLGHFERPPYNRSDVRSIYHVREYDVQKLMQIEESIDIFLSHDWPCGITDYGNSEQLIRFKPYFREQIEGRTLGSKAAAELLEKLKPPYWFSAHLHCKFAAAIQHGVDGPITKFLALDKCRPGRRFLQIVEIQSEPGLFEINYDEEWLAITREFNSIIPLRNESNFGRIQRTIQDSREWIRNRMQTRGSKPSDFTRTVACHDPSQPVSKKSFPGNSRGCVRNPQTESLLQLLELPYLLDSEISSEEVADKDLDGDSEEIPIDDIDEIEERAETLERIE